MEQINDFRSNLESEGPQVAGRRVNIHCRIHRAAPSSTDVLRFSHDAALIVP
jgi:hypothetical protein